MTTTKQLYDFIKNTEEKCGKSFSTLPELYTEGLDLEQVWEELQLLVRLGVEPAREHHADEIFADMQKRPLRRAN